MNKTFRAYTLDQPPDMWSGCRRETWRSGRRRRGWSRRPRRGPAAAAETGRAKLAAREQRVGRAKGGMPKVTDPEQARPQATAQRNFTDPDSRIMKDGATKSFEQAYNAQAAVDGAKQIIVACGVAQSAADVEQFVPMLTQVTQHLGRAPTAALAAPVPRCEPRDRAGVRGVTGAPVGTGRPGALPRMRRARRVYTPTGRHSVTSYE